MDTVEVKLGDRSYPIEIGQGTLGGLGERLSVLGFRDKVAVVTNPTVRDLYGGMVLEGCRAAGLAPLEIVVPDGEIYKSLAWAGYLYDRLLEGRMERNSPIVALGGGVVGDLAGFVAATFLRGVPYVQAPTTLLAQVDSSVGGKTGVDHPLGKNLIGAFHQPRLVFTDLSALKTLPEREFRNGLAEVIKYGVIADAGFFGFLEERMAQIRGLDMGALAHAVKRSCEIKAEVVSEDEREASGRRAILNFGHTLGHALEAATGYAALSHGEAVALGMVYAARLSLRRGLCGEGDEERIVRLLRAAGLPTTLPKLRFDDLMDYMRFDKKIARNRLTFILTKGVGTVTLDAAVPMELLREVWGELTAGQ
jgi:3-dehydroquinate synthase